MDDCYRASENIKPSLIGSTERSIKSPPTTTPTEPLSSMLEGAKLMREQDAELLESMRFTDSCSTGATPILQPTKSPSLSDLPALTDLIDTNCSGITPPSQPTTPAQQRRDSSKLKPLVAPSQPRFERRTSSKKNNLEESLLDASAFDDLLVEDDPTLMDNDDQQIILQETSSSSSQREALHLHSHSPRELNHGASYRQCLSGDVRLALDDNELEEQDATATTNTATTTPHIEDGPEESLAATAAAVASSNSPISVTQEVEHPVVERVESRIVRTKSMDRRMCEAYQFAEAVGEIIPPLNQTIIDEGGSDDDDDDGNAKEIRLDERLPRDSTKEALVVVPADCSSHPNKVTPAATVVVGKTRPQWPFSTSGRSTFLFQLPDGVSTPDFVYKGICANPPEITTHGISRGNYAQLHRKAWLEVSDKYHRYGKNLRLYYRYWEALGFPTNSFFDWLDSKGEAAGQPLPNLDECPRSQLDSDTVLYIFNPEATHGYSLNIVPDGKGRGLVLDVDGEKVKTGSEGWIFVLRDNVMYGALKITSISGHSKQRFHHSSFFGGKAVAAAGIIFTDDDGYLIRLYPHSGHYRPGEAHIQRMLFFLHHKGVDLRTFEMDTQQILHVARDHDASAAAVLGDGSGKTKKNGSEKKKKIQSLHLKPAVYVACFLAHKARFIGAGIFTIIHKIRKADVTTVSEALDAVDDGGYWKQQVRGTA